MLGRRHRQSRLPAQDSNIELGPGRSQSLEKVGDAIAVLTTATRLWMQQRLRLERPIQKMDGPPRLLHRLGRGGEIGLHIDQDCGPGRPRAPPTGVGFG